VGFLGIAFLQEKLITKVPTGNWNHSGYLNLGGLFTAPASIVTTGLTYWVVHANTDAVNPRAYGRRKKLVDQGIRKNTSSFETTESILEVEKNLIGIFQ
jgi:hypothetical protein